MSKLLIPLLLATAQAAPAQQEQQAPADQPSGTIIVEGQRNPGRTIDNFVRDLTPARMGGQLARFEDPVCPVVLGSVATPRTRTSPAGTGVCCSTGSDGGSGTPSRSQFSAKAGA